jgi:hypothetical protein
MLYPRITGAYLPIAGLAPSLNIGTLTGLKENMPECSDERPAMKSTPPASSANAAVLPIADKRRLVI